MSELRAHYPKALTKITLIAAVVEEIIAPTIAETRPEPRGKLHVLDVLDGPANTGYTWEKRTVTGAVQCPYKKIHF